MIFGGLELTAPTTNIASPTQSPIDLERLEFGSALRDHSPQAIHEKFIDFALPLTALSFDFSRHIRALISEAQAAERIPSGKILSARAAA